MLFLDYVRIIVSYTYLIILITTLIYFQCKVLDGSYDYTEGVAGLETALAILCTQAEEASRAGYQLIVLSDRRAGPDRVPVSTLLALGMSLNCLN